MPKDEQVANFERRRQHGAPKDKKWHNKKYLYEIREDFARIQNEVLAKNGYSIRVDHRTLKAQRVEEERHGDNFLANLYKRMPESYVRILPIQEESEASCAVHRYRNNIQSKQHVLFQADIQQKMAEEFETKLLVRQAEYAFLALMNSQAYKSANMNDESLRDLNQEILAGFERIKEVKRELVGVLRAQQRAQKEYLSVADHSFLIDYENKLRQRDNLQRLLTQLIPPPEKQHTIQLAITKKISDLRFFLAQHNPQYWAILEKLDEPYQRKNIELVMHRLLQNDLDVLRDLKKTSTDVLKKVADLRAKIEVQEMPKRIFTSREVRDNLFQQYRSLKKQREEAVDICNRLMLKRVFPSDAMSIAKNIFVHNGFKKLCIEQEEYEKALANYQHETSEIRERELLFINKKWSNRAERFQAQYYLTKAKIHLEETGRRLSDTKIQLENE